MTAHEENHGSIDISPTAVATIANQAINQCYGVVGMASKGLAGGIAQLLTRDHHRGIDVHMDDEGVVVDVYVIVQYGIRIRVVAESVQNTVRFHIEHALGLPVSAVNVYVQGLRMNDDNAD